MSKKHVVIGSCLAAVILIVTVGGFLIFYTSPDRPDINTANRQLTGESLVEQADKHKEDGLNMVSELNYDGALLNFNRALALYKMQGASAGASVSDMEQLIVQTKEEAAKFSETKQNSESRPEAAATCQNISGSTVCAQSEDVLVEE